MNNEFLRLNKKHTGTLIEQRKTKPQETLEFKMDKTMQTYSFSPPINLVEEGNWLLGVTSFEATNSVFKRTNENNSFSITIPGHWDSKSAEKTIYELNNLLELRSLEWHVKEVRKSRNQIKIGDNEYKLSDFEYSKKWDTWRIKNCKIKRSWGFGK